MPTVVAAASPGSERLVISVCHVPFAWRARCSTAPLKPGHVQPAELSTSGRVGWHELLAADWEQALAFYGKLFGSQKADADIGTMGTYQLFSAGGQTIGGMCTKPPEVPVPFWLYYFNVGDIDAAGKRVRAGRGQILNGPIEVPGGNWIVQCTDPQGAMFALWERGATTVSDISSASHRPILPALVLAFVEHDLSSARVP